MSLTDYERLSLINQLLVLKESGSDFYHPEQLDEMVNVLRNGHAAFYNEYVFSVLDSEISNEIHKELMDILYLKHRSLTSLGRIKEPLHADLEEFLRDKIFFFGFDGNDDLESKYIREARYVIYELKRFEILFEKSEDEPEQHFNNHFKTLSIYREELKRHEELNRPYEKDLTLEDLKYIYLAEVTSR